MNVLKALCIIAFLSFIAIGCGSLDSVKNDEVSDQVSDQGGPIIVTIVSGGSIVIPEGALPEWDEVNVKPTIIPILPDDMEPLGKAYLIIASSELSKPATLRLPIPDGVQDISSLVIIRVADDGTISTLESFIEGNEIVACTLGFSTFIIAKKITIADKIKKRYINVYGRDSLYPGEISSYSVRLGSTFSLLYNQTPQAQDIEWNITGPFQAVQIRGLSIIIKSENITVAGSGDITVSFYEHISGYKYLGSRKVRVQMFGSSGELVGKT